MRRDYWWFFLSDIQTSCNLCHKNWLGKARTTEYVYRWGRHRLAVCMCVYTHIYLCIYIYIHKVFKESSNMVWNLYTCSCLLWLCVLDITWKNSTRVVLVQTFSPLAPSSGRTQSSGPLFQEVAQILKRITLQNCRQHIYTEGRAKTKMAAEHHRWRQTT